jgi:hypothetical protein
VKLELSAWSGRTTTLSNVGKAALWPNITDLVAEVDRGILLESKLRVIVMDENSFRKHSLLGAGSVSLRRLGPRINSEVELTVDLQDNGVAIGQAVIGATLRVASAEEITETIPEEAITLQKGVLMIKSVAAKDMRGGDSGPFDKQVSPPAPPLSPSS